MLDYKLRKTMEDIFFYEQNRRLQEKRRQIQKLKETKANLAQVSGIRNDAVLDKLLALGIRPETLATLMAIPLIEVAWADGEMHDKERDRLFDYAEKAGLRQQGLDRDIMLTWLRRKPDPALLEAWEHYVQALGQELGPTECRALKDEVMKDARAIAEAAGGFFGFGSISDDEQKMLKRLEAAFD